MQCFVNLKTYSRSSQTVETRSQSREKKGGGGGSGKKGCVIPRRQVVLMLVRGPTYRLRGISNWILRVHSLQQQQQYRLYMLLQPTNQPIPQTTAVLLSEQYYSVSSITQWAVLLSVRYCSVCVIAQCAVLLSVQYCSVCSIAQWAVLFSVHYCSECSIAQCAVLLSVHYCSVCSIDQCAVLLSVKNWSVCVIAQCAELISVQYCSVCIIAQCALCRIAQCALLLCVHCAELLSVHYCSVWELVLHLLQHFQLSVPSFHIYYIILSSFFISAFLGLKIYLQKNSEIHSEPFSRKSGAFIGTERSFLYWILAE